MKWIERHWWVVLVIVFLWWKAVQNRTTTITTTQQDAGSGSGSIVDTITNLSDNATTLSIGAGLVALVALVILL
jgi:hypothetical protein